MGGSPTPGAAPGMLKHPSAAPVQLQQPPNLPQSMGASPKPPYRAVMTGPAEQNKPPLWWLLEDTNTQWHSVAGIHNFRKYIHKEYSAFIAEVKKRQLNH